MVFTEKGKQIDENVQELGLLVASLLKKPDRARHIFQRRLSYSTKLLPQDVFSVELSTFQCTRLPAPKISKDKYTVQYPKDCWYVDLLRGFVCKLI
jgi:hypothetical protein